MSSDDSFADLTIARFHARMAQRELSSAALVDWYLDRIDALDGQVRAVLEISAQAREAARALDAEWAAGKRRGPLHGVPVLVKDNIETGDGLCNTAGSLALEGYRPAADAPLVANLRSAGAVVLGKTNLSEWANFRSSYSSSGWSSRGGQTRNPYSLDRSPGGSSSGSAAAVAADFCLAAIGTETDGSIVNPAAMNGVVGVKPTLGLVSRSGVIPIAHSQDTAGPIARNLADAALVLAALAGTDDADPMTRLAVRPRSEDIATAPDAGDLEGARIGVVRNLFGVSPKSDEVVERALSRMSAAGAEIVDAVNLDTVNEMRTHENEVLRFEFKADLDAFLARAAPSPPVASLSALIDFNRHNAGRVMPLFGQDRLESAQCKDSLESPDYAFALRECARLSRDEGIDRALAAHALDALVAPTNGPARLIDHVNGDGGFWGKTSAPAAVAGYPHVTLTAGYVSGLPVGLSMFARAGDDVRLLGLAAAFERANDPRRPPSFVTGV